MQTKMLAALRFDEFQKNIHAERCVRVIFKRNRNDRLTSNTDVSQDVVWYIFDDLIKLLLLRGLLCVKLPQPV